MRYKVLVAVGVFVCVGIRLCAQEARSVAAEPLGPPYVYNPKAFQGNAASPSSIVRFLASDAGKAILLHSPNPKAKEYLKLFHGDQAAAQWDTTPHLQLPSNQTLRQVWGVPRGVIPAVVTSNAATVSGCGTAMGTRFNLEPRPNAVPQNEESVDFLLNRVATGADLVVQGANDLRGIFTSPPSWDFSLSGYYVHRASTGCEADFEGGLPPLANPNDLKDKVVGVGEPAIVANPANDAIFFADLRFDSEINGIGLFRNSASRLLNASACPSGTHTLSQAVVCWPTTGVPGSAAVMINPGFEFNDRPDIAVDQSTSGIGAGDVYLANTLFNGGYESGTSQIVLTACVNSLSPCAQSQTISAQDNSAQSPSVAVRSNHDITVTYVNIGSFQTLTGRSLQIFDIKYVSCVAAGPGVVPTCNPPVLVYSDAQPLPNGSTLTDNGFSVATYPKHVERADGTTFVFWDRCHVPPDLPFGTGLNCDDADIMVAFSTNEGATWSAPYAINTAPGHQVMPWPALDASTSVTSVAYLNCNDFFKNRCTISLNQIPAGSRTPGAPIAVTTTADSPDAEANLPFSFVIPSNQRFFLPQFGDYIGAAARGTGLAGGSHLYIGYTSNLTLGTYEGGVESNPESNNYLDLVVY